MTGPKTLWDLPDEMLLSGKEVHAATNGQLSNSQLVRGRMDGWGPEFVKTGTGINGRVSYRVSDIKKWLDSRRANNTAQVGAIVDRDRAARRAKINGQS